MAGVRVLIEDSSHEGLTAVDFPTAFDWNTERDDVLHVYEKDGDKKRRVGTFKEWESVMDIDAVGADDEKDPNA